MGTTGTVVCEMFGQSTGRVDLHAMTVSWRVGTGAQARREQPRGHHEQFYSTKIRQILISSIYAWAKDGQDGVVRRCNRPLMPSRVRDIFEGHPREFNRSEFVLQWKLDHGWEQVPKFVQDALSLCNAFQQRPETLVIRADPRNSYLYSLHMDTLVRKNLLTEDERPMRGVHIYVREHTFQEEHRKWCPKWPLPQGARYQPTNREFRPSPKSMPRKSSRRSSKERSRSAPY